MMSDLIMPCQTVSDLVEASLSKILAISWEIRILNFIKIIIILLT